MSPALQRSLRRLYESDADCLTKPVEKGRTLMHQVHARVCLFRRLYASACNIDVSHMCVNPLVTFVRLRGRAWKCGAICRSSCGCNQAIWFHEPPLLL